MGHLAFAPLAAATATSGTELRSVLIGILVVIIAARVAAEIAHRLSLPAVVLEIGTGLVVGPSVLGLVSSGDDVLGVLGQLGVILLLLEVGLELDLGQLRAVGRVAVAVALLGVVAVFIGGGLAGLGLGLDARPAAFVAAALAATSAGIAARVFADLRLLASIEARAVIGAAVADDVISLLLLTVVVGLTSGEQIDLAAIFVVTASAVGFLVAALVVGVKLVPVAFRLLGRLARAPGTLVAFGLAFTLALSVLAQSAGLAPLVGAFVAGLALARTQVAGDIGRELAPLGRLFIPVFFLQIGINARLHDLVQPGTLALAAALTAAVVLARLVAAGGAVGFPGDKLVLAIGMLPRGEVTLVFAGLGLSSGLLERDVYGALVLVALVTTFATGPLLRARIGRSRRVRAGVDVTTREPAGGWIGVDRGIIGLRARPPYAEATHVALCAARLAVVAEPSAELLQWLGDLDPATPLDWDERATAELLGLLREGNARSWRLLDAMGVLDQALPEVGAKVKARRDDAFHLDPSSHLRWSLVERVRDLGTSRSGDYTADAEHDLLVHPDRLLLAAFLVEALGADGNSDPDATRRLVGRLRLDDSSGREVGALVEGSRILSDAARRGDALSPSAIADLASRVTSAERARSLYLLSVFVDGAESQRPRIDEVHRLVQAALVAGSGTSAAAAAGVRAAAMERLVASGDQGAATALKAAPESWLLAFPPGDLVRHARLVAPRPKRGEVRADIIAGPSRDLLIVEVASRDRAGLPARVALTFDRVGLDVRAGGLVRWLPAPGPDAVSLLSLLTSVHPGAVIPDRVELRRRLALSLAEPLPSLPQPGVELAWDHRSPFVAVCSLHTPDRPGLLAAVLTAIGRAGLLVVDGQIRTSDGVADDRFELVRSDGRPPTDEDTQVVTAALSGTPLPRRGRT